VTPLSWRRVRAIVGKELREYRRNRQVIATMVILPLIFMIQPLVAVIRLEAGSAGGLAHEHVLLYMLGIPILVPVILAATAVAGERQQGTLEPVLTTPIRREELILGKALAAFAPSLVVAYAVYGLFLGLVAILANAAVAGALLQGPDLLAQVLFTPLLAAWTTWVGIGISTRLSDARVAQQLGLLASLPAILVVVLVAVDVIHATVGLGVVAAAVLIGLDVAGWRIASLAFDRERLISGTR
jgi:ABC-2 type transport system permease protein